MSKRKGTMMRHNFLRDERGFTLVELLTVISIIGILAAISSLGVVKFRERAVEKACQSDTKNVQVAASAYKASNGAPSGAIADMVPRYLAEDPNVSSSANYSIAYSSDVSNNTFSVTGTLTSSGQICT